MVVRKRDSAVRRSILREGPEDFAGTSEGIGESRVGFATGRGTSAGAEEVHVAKEEISGEVSADAVSRKKYYDAMAKFWKMMWVVVPIAIATVVAFFIYMLTSVTGPIGKMQTDIEYLRKGNAELDNKIEKLPGDMLRSIGKTVEKIEADIKNLREGDAKVNMEIEKLRKEMEIGKRDR